MLKDISQPLLYCLEILGVSLPTHLKAASLWKAVLAAVLETDTIHHAGSQNSILFNDSPSSVHLSLLCVPHPRSEDFLKLPGPSEIRWLRGLLKSMEPHEWNPLHRGCPSRDKHCWSTRWDPITFC